MAPWCFFFASLADDENGGPWALPTVEFEKRLGEMDARRHREL